MKNVLFIKTLCLYVSFVAIATGCRKPDTITLKTPTACFTVQRTNEFTNIQVPGTRANIDSTFYFSNCSDSGANITYRWHFGDGSTSTERNPQHNFRKRGKYPVTLIVSDNNKSYDTVQQTLSVYLGQQHISLGDVIAPVAIEVTVTNEFVLLASTGSNVHLIQVDSLLKQKSIKSFPSSYLLTSMKSTSDGNYILTGSTQSANKSNELIKMKADGTELWRKVLSANDRYRYAAQMEDGGYAVIGLRPVDRPSGTSYNTVVIKTDHNANEQWQRLMDKEGMITTKDAVIEQDGIVIAGVKRGATVFCDNCDSLLIMKLNNAGNITWKTTVLWGLNNNTWSDTRITRLTNGNYAVTNEFTGGIFFFSPSGNFLSRQLVPYRVRSITNTIDGNMIILQDEYGNGNRMNIAKFTFDGVRQWSVYADGRQRLPGGQLSCCSSIWPVAIRSLPNGSTIATGYRVDDNSTGLKTSIVLLELDDTGNIK